jgi:hypothetical protein
MKQLWIPVGVLLCLLAGVQVGEAGMKHQFGVGARYWMAVGDIEADELDEEGLSWMLSYQLQPIPLVRLEVDLEMMPESLGAYGTADENVYAPQVFALVGMGLYAGVGAGMYFADGEFWDNPFFMLRGGGNLELLPNLFLDINLNYRFENWDEFEGSDISEDTIFLGAAVRLQI